MRRRASPIGFYLGRDGMDAYWRMKLPAGELARRGFDVRLLPDLEPATLKEFGTVLVHRPYDEESLSGLLGAPGDTRVVLSIDENFEGVESGNPAFDKDVHTERLRGLWAEAVQSADEILVANAALREHYAAYNPDSTVVPDMIEPRHFEAADARASQREGLAVGWRAVGARGSMPDGLAGALALFGRRHPEVRFVRLGAAGASEKLPCEQIDEPPWPHLPQSIARLRLDVGLVVLEDSAYDLCLTAIPCLELAACGVPVVASALGSCASVIEHGVTGLLASGDWEWGAFLERLVGDADQRKQMSLAARERLRLRHSPEVVGSRYAELADRWLS